MATAFESMTACLPTPRPDTEDTSERQVILRVFLHWLRSCRAFLARYSAAPRYACCGRPFRCPLTLILASCAFAAFIRRNNCASCVQVRLWLGGIGHWTVEALARTPDSYGYTQDTRKKLVLHGWH